jgi:hypothetical protein
VREVARSAAPGRSFPLTNNMSAVTPDLYRPMYGAEVGSSLAFHSLNLPNPRQVPIGPNAIIDDNITIARSS